MFSAATASTRSSKIARATSGSPHSALAHAALTCAAYNVRTNLLGLEDTRVVADLTAKLRVMETGSVEQQEYMQKTLTERGGIPLG